MSRPFTKPEFEKIPPDRRGTERDQQERAAQALVEVLGLAEALPYEPRRTLDIKNIIDLNRDTASSAAGRVAEMMGEDDPVTVRLNAMLEFRPDG